MKLRFEYNENEPRRSRTYVEKAECETVLTKNPFYCDERTLIGELHIPEGVERIQKHAFVGCHYRTFYFPSTLTSLEEDLFSSGFSLRYRVPVTIIYNGTSEAFMALAEPRVESVYETDGYDHYPYYSGNSAWVTKYFAFDTDTESITVNCTDGVTLLYGSENRKEDEPPKIIPADNSES